jgi:hypothetical protein
MEHNFLFMKEECPICFDEMLTVCKLRGCTHGVCADCHKVLSDNHPISPFGEYVDIPMHFSAIPCPMCRAVEPSPVTPFVFQRLCEYYPMAYRIWFETELFRGEDGTFFFTSHRKKNVRLFPNYAENLLFILDRVTLGTRSTACMFEDKELLNDPEYFYIWDPIKHDYPHPRPNLVGV